MRTPAIDAQAVSKRFVLRHNRGASLKVRFLGLLHKRQREVLEDFWALRDVSLRVAPGESVALVGRNGSGKSTFLKLVAGVHRPTSGRLLLGATARIGSMIELGVGFHPDLNGTENVFLNAAIHGLTRGEIKEMYPRIVEYSGLGHFMDVPLKNYSSGMHMRLGFAVAANLDPDILLLDEIFAVGDQDFQKQCMRTMEQFASEGRTLLFVSHSADSVRTICRRVCVLEQGRMLFDGGVNEGLEEYQKLIAQPRMAPVDDADIDEATDEGLAAPDSPAARDGAWALDLLQREGLQPHHRVLEITCDADGGNLALAKYVGAARYQHWEVSAPMAGPVRAFDYAIASPLLSAISLNAAARCLSIAGRVMEPGARIYATWIDHDRTIDVSDVPPFRYPLSLISGVCDAVGLRATRIPEAGPKPGDAVAVLEPRV